MSYRLQPTESLGVEVVRVFREQIDRAALRAADGRIDIRERAHAARTACKRVRALLRLVRTQSPKRWRRENIRFRDAARELSALRDATARANIFNLLLKSVEPRNRRRFAPIRRHLEASQREALADRRNTTQRLSHFVERMEEAAQRAVGWKLEGDGFDIVGDGFQVTYRRARRALRDAWAEPSPANFHAWRKDVKAHTYHYRLFRCAWPRVMKNWQAELATLATLLGEEHDLTVLREYLASESSLSLDPEILMAAMVLIEARQSALRNQAILLGRRLFADKPRAHLRRLSIWWATAREAAADGLAKR